MSSTSYKALVALFSAGLLFALGMWFGLAVVSGPKGHSRVASVPLGTTPLSTQPRLSTQGQQKTEKPHEAVAADRAADRKLTPIYPAAPGAAKEKADAADRKNPNDTMVTNAATAEPVPAAAQHPIETTGSASPAAHAAHAASDGENPKREVKSNSEPKSERPTRSTALSATQSANQCDVRACADAYKSFRESDCTYQPFSGPRQLCVKPSMLTRRQVDEPTAYRAGAQAAQQDQNADLEGAVRAVRKLTGRRWSRDSNRWDEDIRDEPPDRIYVVPDDDD